MQFGWGNTGPRRWEEGFRKSPNGAVSYVFRVGVCAPQTDSAAMGLEEQRTSNGSGTWFPFATLFTLL